MTLVGIEHHRKCHGRHEKSVPFLRDELGETPADRFDGSV